MSWQLALGVARRRAGAGEGVELVPARVEQGVPRAARARRRHAHARSRRAWPACASCRRSTRRTCSAAGSGRRTSASSETQPARRTDHRQVHDDHRAGPGRRDRADPVLRRLAHRPGRRHRRDARRVRAVPPEPVRADPADEPAVQHDAGGGRGAAEAVRAARRGRRRSTSGPARSTSRPTGALEVDDVVVPLRQRSARARRRVARRRAGPAHRARRPDRCREVDARQADGAVLRPGRRARSATAASTCATRRCTRCGERIVVVPQEGFLFGGTIRDNLLIARSGRDRRRRSTRRSTRSTSAIASPRSPTGSTPRCTNAGANFSAGERQLVSLVRAALADPAVVVLDEATSSLDPGTELLVEHALERLMEGRTVVVIAHRL